jgi:hypothetical protein
MTTTLSLVFIIAIFLILSYWIHRLLLNLKKSIFWVVTILYFLITYGLFELSNYIHIFLREYGIYLEFGHASLLLVMVFFFCIILALLNVGFAGYKRHKQKSFTA